MTLDSFQTHLATLESRWDEALGAAGFDAAVLSAGQGRPYFLDDQSPPFRANPHFQQWFPADGCEGSVLVIRPGRRPLLYFLQPDDYWHQPPALPEWAEKAFEVHVYAEPAPLEEAVWSAVSAFGRVASIGDSAGSNTPAAARNPERLLDHLHFLRARKTGFELAAMRAATRDAVAGHVAARARFLAGTPVSEFELNLAYLAAARTTSAELPYASIVALNRHAGVLHYQHYDRIPPPKLESFLIDAGARSQGYAADITRTYSAADDAFAELIARLDVEQQALVDSLAPGVDFVDVHIDAHRRIGKVLHESGLVRCAAEHAFESGITRAFFPHGLGHLIGLQTHDVAGQQTDRSGARRPPPAVYPSLRLTRVLETGTVVTIEPGLYFIPQLLDALRSGPLRGEIDWSRVEALASRGGIRIEDNVVIQDTGNENLTRAAFAETGQQDAR